MNEIEFEIDGRILKAKPNQTVIQAADEAGIYIPRFCYHKHLSIPANCRMCLVDVEKSPKPLPACATPIMPGMKVSTTSQKSVVAQRDVMEFLLINHPLDCPICDQGGECELQDLAMGYGCSHSHFDETKRSVADEDLGPLVATEMTRCINCTRCVRFGNEMAGLYELGQLFRGEVTEISTYVQQGVKSEISGNIIDLCPVGALTSKPYRFTARPWELDQWPTISPHDCLGTNLYAHTRQGKLMRIVARENSNINETWIADRDRFSYTGLNHPDRLSAPMMKIDGVWHTVDWQTAFETMINELRSIIRDHGADQLGALASPSSTVEELYLLQKLIRALGSSHIDHRLYETDMTDQSSCPLMPVSEVTLTDLEQADGILLIGSNLRKEQPLAALRVRKAIRQGASVATINAVDYDFHFPVEAKKIIPPHQWVATLSGLIDALNSDEVVDEHYYPLLKAMANKKRIVIILGALALHHPQAAYLRHLVRQLSQKMSGKVMFMTLGANTAGGWLTGAVPHRLPGGVEAPSVGLSANEMWRNPRKAYFLLNTEPELESAHPALALNALKQAKYVIALSLYKTDYLQSYAHVMLPMAAFTETSGSYINVNGDWQSFAGVAEPFQEARPAWKILRVLGSLLGLPGFEYESTEEVKQELMALAKQTEFSVKPYHAKEHSSSFSEDVLSRIPEIPIYAIDSLVRHALPLQAAQQLMDGNQVCIAMHPETAKRMQCEHQTKVWVKQENSEEILLPLTLDHRMTKEAAWIPAGIPESVGFHSLFGNIKIRRAEEV